MITQENNSENATVNSAILSSIPNMPFTYIKPGVQQASQQPQLGK